MLVFGAPTPARSVPSRVWCSMRHMRAPTTASEGPFMTISEGSHLRALSPGALQRPLRALVTTAEGPTETPGATLASEGPYDGL